MTRGEPSLHPAGWGAVVPQLWSPELRVTSPFPAGGEGAITSVPTPSWEKHVVPGL